MEQGRKSVRWCVVLSAALFMVAFWPTAPADAQTPTADMATIEGSVLDPDGKAVVNAAVVVRNTLTGDVRATVSDPGGHFVVDLLTVGAYEVEASAPGFAANCRGGVQVSAGNPISLTLMFDRSPGSASTIGPSTYGGSVNFLSRNLGSKPMLRGSASYGSFNTRLLDAEFDSGRFGGSDGRSRLLVDVHQMESDGYQTYNWQRRNAFSAKYQYAASEKTAVTAFASVIDLRSNTPNQKGSTRAQVEQFGDNFLLTDDPVSPLYFGYNLTCSTATRLPASARRRPGRTCRRPVMC